MATSAPSRAKRRAMAAPMPREPPVMRATLLARGLDMLFSEKVSDDGMKGRSDTAPTNGGAGYANLGWQALCRGQADTGRGASDQRDASWASLMLTMNLAFCTRCRVGSEVWSMMRRRYYAARASAATTFVAT